MKRQRINQNVICWIVSRTSSSWRHAVWNRFIMATHRTTTINYDHYYLNTILISKFDFNGFRLNQRYCSQTSNNPFARESVMRNKENAFNEWLFKQWETVLKLLHVKQENYNRFLRFWFRKILILISKGLNICETISMVGWDASAIAFHFLHRGTGKQKHEKTK